MMKCNRAHNWKKKINHENPWDTIIHTENQLTYFSHGVLNWSSSQQEPIPAVELKKNLPPHTEMTSRKDPKFNAITAVDENRKVMTSKPNLEVLLMA